MMREPRQSSGSGRATEAAAGPGRAIVIAVDLTGGSDPAVLWALHEFYRPGDTVHLVHVVRMLNPNYSIQHSEREGGEEREEREGTTMGREGGGGLVRAGQGVGRHKLW